MVSNVTSGSSICPFSLVLPMMLLETSTIEIRKDFCKFLVASLIESLGLVLKGWIWAQGRMSCSLISETRPWYFRMATLDSGRLATGTLAIHNSGTEQKQPVFALGQGMGSFTKCFMVLVASDLSSLNFILRIGFVAWGKSFHRSSVVSGTGAAEGWRSTLPSPWWTDTTWRWEEEQPQLASSVSSD